MTDTGKCLRCGGWVWECGQRTDDCLKHLRERADELEYRVERLESRLGGDKVGQPS